MHEEPNNKGVHIVIVGAGTIGLSFAALHLAQGQDVVITICDPRPDIEDYIRAHLPAMLGETRDINDLFSTGQLRLDAEVEHAVSSANIVQEQGPENIAFKQKIWPEVERFAPPDCLFWSSTSGIPASVQSEHMKDPSRLLIVHPYNPPHVMPLLEVVPAPATSREVVSRTLAYWESVGRSPVVVKKEVTGFVANRLAFALLREAIHLVDEGVVTVEELDHIVTDSMGPRWAKAGPFKSYHAGGGAGGFEGLMKNIGGTVQACWDDSGKVDMGGKWEETVYSQTKKAYGTGP